MTVKVLVNGAAGRMGQEVIKALRNNDELECVAQVDKSDNLVAMIESTKPDVVIEFTNAGVVYENTQKIIAAGVRPVVGATGLTAEQIEELTLECKTLKLGCLIVPNFSIGAVLMMRLAKEVAHYLPQAEIIEMHHDKKLDAPSGTAIKTAEMIAESRQHDVKTLAEHENFTGSRGAVVKGVPIHAIRLPGFVANQQVIFGGQAETLRIEHTTLDRSCFMPGVIMACKKVMQLNTLVYGLENILD